MSVNNRTRNSKREWRLLMIELQQSERLYEPAVPIRGPDQIFELIEQDVLRSQEEEALRGFRSLPIPAFRFADRLTELRGIRRREAAAAAFRD